MTPGLIDDCIRVHRARLGLPADAPITPAEREAMASVLDVAASHRPGIMAHIERARGPAVADELRGRRVARELDELKRQAAPTIAAVARQASAETGGEVTPELLLSRARYLWLSRWRRRAWWLLTRQGMNHGQIGRVFGRGVATIGDGVRECEAEERAKSAGKEAVG